MATEAVEAQHDTIVNLRPDVRRKFYPGFILLEYLRETQPRRRNKHVDRALHPSFNLEDQFQEFACKLALLCQTKTGGDTVSACAVLQAVEGHILYVFASNQRDGNEREEIKSRVASFLSMLKRKSEPPGKLERLEEQRRQCLYVILKLQVNRIRSYLRALVDNASACARSCDGDGTMDGPILRSELLSMLTGANVALNAVGSKGDTLSIQSLQLLENLLVRLKAFRRWEVQRMVRPRLVREETLGSLKHWYEIGHVMARLLCYDQAAETFLDASETWPELFDKFQIDFIASCPRQTNALRFKPMTAEDIIRRLALDENMRTGLVNSVSSLQKFQLDKAIEEKWQKGLHPVVHAEVLLHNWLETTEGGTHSERFFRGYKFIGTSKPPCRLCSFYFKETGTDVKLHPSHGNLYTSWRVPDVFVWQGEDALRRRETIMMGMRSQICWDIMKTMGDKLAEGRPHDSTSRSNYTVDRGATRGDAHLPLNDIMQRVEALSLRSSLGRLPALVPSLAQINAREEDVWSITGLRRDSDSDGETIQLSNEDTAAAETDEVEDDVDIVLFKGRRNRRL